MAHIRFWLLAMMLIYWEEVYVHTLKENAEALLAATREIGLEVSVDNTKYIASKRAHDRPGQE